MAKIEKTFDGKGFTYLCNGEVYKHSTRDYKYACVATTRKAKAAIPMGKELTKVDMFSYQTLRRIVAQRHNHRLPEWHTFIDWIRTLPYAEELIFVGLETEE